MADSIRTNQLELKDFIKKGVLNIHAHDPAGVEVSFRLEYPRKQSQKIAQKRNSTVKFYTPVSKLNK